MSEIALKVPGIVDSVAFPGLSIAGFSAAPNEGIVFFGLAPFEKRTTPELSQGRASSARSTARSSRSRARACSSCRRRRSTAWATRAASSCRCRTATASASRRCTARCGARSGQVYGNPKSSIGTPFSTYDINVPQLFANVDRTKAKQMGVKLNDIYDTLQINLGSLYVNDFNQLRQDLPGDRAGRCAVPRRRRRRSPT